MKQKQKNRNRPRSFIESYSEDAQVFIWEIRDLDSYQPHIIIVHPTGRRQLLIVRDDGFHIN